MELRAYRLRAWNGIFAGIISIALLTSASAALQAAPGPAPTTPRPEVYHPAPLTREVARVKAVGNILNDDYGMARVYADIADDGAISSLLEWRQMIFADDQGAFERIADFTRRHPDWPGDDKMRARAERTLRQWPRSPEVVASFFKDHAPITITGKLAYADALSALGKPLTAKRIVRTVWREEALSASLESEILERYTDILRKQDHEARFAQRIYESDLSGALRIASKLDDNETAEQIAKAAIALAKGHREGFKLYEKLSVGAKARLPVRYGLTRYYRLQEKEDAARKVALKAKPLPHDHYDAATWWQEKRILIRHALRKGEQEHFQEAYDLARTHANTTGLGFVEGEFLSGWIGLRFLEQPARAAVHFKTLASGNDRPVNIAQGEYWAGRAYDAMGKQAEAARHYRRAGTFSTTFYGQLARDRLGWPRVTITATTAPPPRLDAFAALENNELFRVARLIAEMGHDKFVPMFFRAVIKAAETRDEKAAAIHWVWHSGRPHIALRLAKAASIDDMQLGQHSYPAPHWEVEPLTPEPERALVYAVIRQESEFNPSARSHADARGLMQIMPKTARGLSRNYNAAYDLARLTTDPAYNIQLGSALLHELLNTFDDHYPLVLAAYNAGPGPVYRWIEEYGDPRKGEIDQLDWIEMIPYTETRNYVKRVMENVNVYRGLFGTEQPDMLFVGLQRSLKGDLQRQASSCESSKSAAGATATCEIEIIPAGSMARGAAMQ